MHKLKNAARREMHQLVHPYYWINLILCLSFIGLRLVDPLCHWTFGDTWESIKQEDCELDMRESEILFFLLIIIMIRLALTLKEFLRTYLCKLVLFSFKSTYVI